MNKNRMGTVSVMIVGAILLIVFLFIAYAALDSGRPQIVLPDSASTQEPADPESGEGNRDLAARLEVTPSSVQNVIATLARPEAYSQELSITMYWSGGSGTAYVNSYVRDGAVRMDTVLPDGQWRHILRDGGQTYIWYNSDTADVYQAPTGSFSVDDELWVPTYEDLLEVAPERLAEAGYETYLETDCIYAATAEDGDGYAERYWIAVDSGLLVAAERLQNGQTVYLMEASDTTVSEPSPELFTLPDGTALSAAAD